MKGEWTPSHLKLRDMAASGLFQEFSYEVLIWYFDKVRFHPVR